MIYAIGDIHGQLPKLRDLLKRLDAGGLTPEDWVVFLGDYTDRGPDSAGVIQTLIELEATRPLTVFLRGNHDQMMMDARQHFDNTFDADNICGDITAGMLWFAVGATETLASYGPANGRRWFQMIPDSHWNFLRRTRMEFNHGVYTFVHAGLVPPGKRWFMPEFQADPRLWIRHEFIASKSDFNGKTIVFGHTPTRDGKPLLLRNKVAVDTGAGYGAPLTAVGLPDRYDPKDVAVFQA